MFNRLGEPTMVSWLPPLTRVRPKSRPSDFHPPVAISGVDARSRKLHSGFATLLENSCRSGIDPIPAGQCSAIHSPKVAEDP